MLSRMESNHRISARTEQLDYSPVHANQHHALLNFIVGEVGLEPRLSTLKELRLNQFVYGSISQAPHQSAITHLSDLTSQRPIYGIHNPKYA